MASLLAEIAGTNEYKTKILTAVAVEGQCVRLVYNVDPVMDLSFLSLQSESESVKEKV